MIIIEVNHVKIAVNDEQVINMKKNFSNSNSQNIYIRNKSDAQKLSTQTLQTLEEGRKERFNEAIRNNDMLYLTNMLYNLSIFDICKLLIKKSTKYI